MSCEDQALVATKHCTQCRSGFTESGAPIYPALVKRGDFWCCPLCHGSYGASPHPDLTHKDRGGQVGMNGECLVCTAEQGERCR